MDKGLAAVGNYVYSGDPQVAVQTDQWAVAKW